MPRCLLLFVLATFLLCTGLWAQEPAPLQEPKPATQEAQPPAKTPPDAFHYFFGQKDKKDGKDAKEGKEPEAKAVAPAKKAEPGAVKEAPVPAPQQVPETPIAAPAPVAPTAEATAAPVPEPQLQPQPEAEKSARPAPRVDAFQYFFGKSAQPAAKPEEKKAETAGKKPVDAFDYLFGPKDKEAATGESAKKPAKPPGL
jgi:hypothetical protein